MEKGWGGLPLNSTSFYDPQSRDVSIRQLTVGLDGTQISEKLLLDLYKKHLPAIHAAVERER